MNSWAVHTKNRGDYLLPCLTLPAEKEQPIGYGGERVPVAHKLRTDRAGRRDQLHLQYLKEYRRVTYLNLLTSGRLNTYLADIDKQAEELFFRRVEQMKQAQGITERLKEENALEWVQRMNNIQACAREIMEKEIIYA